MEQNKPTLHKTSQPENKIMKTTDSIKNSFIKRHCLSLAIVTFGLTLSLKPAAHAQGEEPSSFHLEAIAPCLANAVAKVTVFPREENHGVDTLELRAHGLPPNTTFAVFLTELPVPPFGAVQYIADFTTNAAGRGHVRVDAIINEAFAFNNITGVRTDLNHIVFWFADPADDEDCVPGSPPTHFDGDGVAGVAAMSSKNFLPGAPLP